MLVMLAGLLQLAGASRSRLSSDALQADVSVADSEASSSGLRCCCSEKRGQPLVCRYLKATGRGTCPVADLGHGPAQTVPGSRCELRGEEVVEELPISEERQKCIASQMLDSSIFPPEKFGHYALRLVVPGVKSVGDVYLAVEEVDVLNLEGSLELERLDDRTFAFKLDGPSKKHDGAIANVYVKGLQMQMPKSSMDTVLNIASKTEQALANIFTLGNAGHWASLENTPLDISLRMAGSFRLSETGEWEVVQSTRQQYAKVKIKSGGTLNLLINQVIKAFGGMDELFYDLVWPHLQKLVPARLGAAFQQVPHNEGHISHRFHIKASCVGREGLRCPGQRMTIDVRGDTSLRADPGPIIRKLDAEDYFQDSPYLRGLYHNVVNMYDKGEDVFAGATVGADVSASVKQGGEVIASLHPSVHVPMSALFSVVGPQVPLANFLPKIGETAVAGSLDIHGGKVHAHELRVHPLVLPIGVNSDTMELSATLEDLEIEAEEAAEDDLIFSSSSPMSLTVPGIKTTLGFESGFHFTSEQRNNKESTLATFEGEAIGDAASVKFVAPFLQDLSASVGDALQSSPNERPACEICADGLVPERWQRPFAEEKTPFDLERVMDEAFGNAKFTLKPLVHQQHELIDLDIKWDAQLNLTLGSYFWRSLLQLSDPDFGYLHLVTAGTFGERWRGELPTAPAVVFLSCGKLAVYSLPSSHKKALKAEPFSLESLQWTMDLRDNASLEAWAKPQCKDGTCCVKVGLSQGFITRIFQKKEYLCASASEMENLGSAIRLQAKRFEDASKRWRSACFPGANGKAPVCMGNPDGTWFRIPQPLNASTSFPGRGPPKRASDVQPPSLEWQYGVGLAFQPR